MEEKSHHSPGSIITIISLNLGRFLNVEIPDSLVETVRRVLAEDVRQDRLLGATAWAFGPDLHLHLTHLNGGDPVEDFEEVHCSKRAVECALKAAGAAIQKAVDMKISSQDVVKIASLSRQEQAEALDLRCLHYPFTERGAEPIFVAKAIDAGWGFFNRALFNLFFNPDKGSGRRIEGNDFLGVVESIEDLAEDRDEIRAFEFGPGAVNEMLALIADAEQWRLSRVYAVSGKFGRGKLSPEPVALVEGSFNPVMIGRSQSGLPAIGEYTQAVGEFYFGPGGPAGRYRVGLLPSTFPEAQRLSSLPGTARVVSYAYQSFGGGCLPDDSDIVDVFDQNRAETTRLQRESSRLVRFMVDHGEFEPYLNPAAAESRAVAESDLLSDRLESIPDDNDSILERLNERALFTLSDIKADSGGKVGHTSPPNHFQSVAEASLEEAKREGLILPTSEIIEVGDDGHLLMSHKMGADSNDIHLFAYRTFFRQVWVAEVLGYKWYGLGQDLVGEASAGRTTEELAHLNDTFLSLLPEHLPPAERAQMDHLRKAYSQWKSGLGRGHKPLKVFAGNVSGQGPGFAEMPMLDPGRVALLAIDKAGPSAFNLPVFWSLQNAFQDGSLPLYLQNRGARGAVVEVWDIEHHKRVFLDWEQEWKKVQNLLGAIERFNVKRIWSRSSANWNPSRPKQGLDEILLTASTEKLSVITNGEYRGKDDPVLLAVEPLAQALHLFMRDHFYLTQGDGRGSHFMFPTPLAFRDAVATINSRAVCVSAWVTLDGEGEICGFRDVFADPAYEAARDRAFAANKAIWDAQGGNFIPVGVGAAKVEQSYPLAKTLARITAPDSKFVSRRARRRVAPAELVGAGS